MNITPFIKDDENVLLLNTQYLSPVKDDMTGKWSDAYLYLTYRDLDTREKNVRTIKNPSTDIFFTRPEFRNSFRTQRAFLEEFKTYKTQAPFTGIARVIKKEIIDDGVDTDLLKVCDNIPKEAFKWRHSYFADYNINDYAMMSYIFNRSTDNMDTTTSKAFLDIESDIYGLTNSEMDDCEGPINAISVVCEYNELGVKFNHPKVFTFLLRNHVRYKQQEYFEDHLDEFIAECHQEFDKKYNEPSFIIRVFDDEITLLKKIFAVLHKLRPDFILIWNMSYDIPTMIKRLEKLGENPADYFCHPDFERSYYKYNYDRIFKNDFKRKSESFNCTSYSVWGDQMLNYAAIRKAKADYGGNSLDNVAHIELNAEKRKYSKRTVTVKNGAIEEYWNFVKYSINDVLLQYGIDAKTDDLTSLFLQSLEGGTRLHKVMKQTVYLKNVFALGYLRKDLVPRNNNNVNYSSYGSEEEAVDVEVTNSEDAQVDYDDLSLPGAVVGNPNLNAHEGAVILGERSKWLFVYVVDEDFAAMYPNAIVTANIAEHTQIGRIIIKTRCIENENPDNNPAFIRGGKFAEDLELKDLNKVGRWIGLRSTYDYLREYSKIRRASI